MKKERKGQILSLIAALKNNEINMSSMEKEKTMNELLNALESMTEKPLLKTEKDNHRNKQINQQKINAIDEIYFGGKKKFQNHPCLSSSVEFGNNLGENTNVSDKIQNLIDHFMNQNKIEQNLQFNPDSHSFKGNKDLDEFINNEKIRFNHLSHDHPNYKEKGKEENKKEEEYVVYKFGGEIKKSNNLSHSVDPNRTIIKIYNSGDSNQERVNKMKMLNNLNKSSLIELNQQDKPNNNNVNRLRNSAVNVNNDDLFGKPYKITKELSKERKGYPLVIKEIQKEKNQAQIRRNEIKKKKRTKITLNNNRKVKSKIIKNF